MHRDIVIKWFYPSSPEEVWECLTDPELIGQWLMKNDFRPVLGHKFQFRSKPKPAFKWDGIVYCEVTELVLNKRLSYTWKGGQAGKEGNLDTVVTWTLQAKDGGTELTLEHRGFAGAKNYLVSFMMESGWKKHIAKRFAKELQVMTHEK